MTPLPKPSWGWLPWSPKKKWNQGSPLRGCLSAALLVLMLTTAGDARLAAGLKLPAATGPDPPDGASMTDTAPLSVGRLFSHSGLHDTDDKIRGQQHRDGLREQQPESFHAVKPGFARSGGGQIVGGPAAAGGRARRQPAGIQGQ
jgi:hypothetical protein